MTSEEIARLRGLLEAAEPLPWSVGDCGELVGVYARNSAADAALIAAAVHALPGLLDEVERLRAKADQYERDWYDAKADTERMLADAAARERAAIVAWLRRVRPHLDRTADDIERGEHER